MYEVLDKKDNKIENQMENTNSSNPRVMNSMPVRQAMQDVRYDYAADRRIGMTGAGRGVIQYCKDEPKETETLRVIQPGQAVIQGMFKFQMGDINEGFCIKNFVYQRDNKYNTLIKKKTGKHTTADGIRKLFFFENQIIPIDAFYFRLKNIIMTVLNRTSNEFNDLVDNNFQDMVQTAGRLEGEIVEIFVNLEAKCGDFSQLDYEHAFIFQNQVLALLDKFEEYYAYCPLINIDCGNNEYGNGEGTAIADAQEDMRNNDVQTYIEDIIRLFDMQSVAAIAGCRDLEELRDYLPWLGNTNAEIESLKSRMINSMIADHASMATAIWGGGGFGLSEAVGAALRNSIIDEYGYDPEIFGEE